MLDSIKLIITDVDNTLVKESSMDLNKEYLLVMKKLIDRGIKIGVASGRGYQTLEYMFKDIKENVFFLPENGCRVIKNDEALFTTFIEKDVAKEIIDLAHELNMGIPVASIPRGSFIEKKDMNPELFARLKKGVENAAFVVDDLHEVENECLKISFMCKENIAEAENKYVERFAKRLNIAVSGFVWFDLTPQNGNKGYATKFIQDKYNIGIDETMVFGDNYNDIPMFDRAKYSYVSELAKERVKEKASFEFENFENFGVLKVLKKVLSGTL